MKFKTQERLFKVASVLGVSLATVLTLNLVVDASHHKLETLNKSSHQHTLQLAEQANQPRG